MYHDPTAKVLNHALTSGVIGITGGATWVALVWFADFPAFWGLWTMVRLTTVCALMGGLLVAPLFGRDGVGGIGWAALGASVSTIAGSVLAVAIVESPEAALWGPIMVFGAIAAQPGVGGVWLLGMMAAHLVAVPTATPESSDYP